MGLTDNWQMGKPFNCMTTDICFPAHPDPYFEPLDAIFNGADNKNYIG